MVCFLFSSCASYPLIWTQVMEERISTASLKEHDSASMINLSGPPQRWHPKQYAICLLGLMIKLGVFSVCHGKGQSAL